MITGPRRYAYRLLLAVVLLLLPALACNPVAGLKIEKQQLTVRQFTGDLNGTRSVAILSGEARNIGVPAIVNPVIEVTFYDDQKAIIGVAQATTALVESGDTWNFSAQLTSPDAWKVRGYNMTTSAR